MQQITRGSAATRCSTVVTTGLQAVLADLVCCVHALHDRQPKPCLFAAAWKLAALSTPQVSIPDMGSRYGVVLCTLAVPCYAVMLSIHWVLAV